MFFIYKKICRIEEIFPEFLERISRRNKHVEIFPYLWEIDDELLDIIIERNN